VRTFTSLGRKVVTESGLEIGKCRDLRATLELGLAVRSGHRGRRARMARAPRVIRPSSRRKDAVPWEAVVIEGEQTSCGMAPSS
jgi:hypothetical protein